VTAAKVARTRLYGSTVHPSRKKISAVSISRCTTTLNSLCSPCVSFRLDGSLTNLGDSCTTVYKIVNKCLITLFAYEITFIHHFGG